LVVKSWKRGDPPAVVGRARRAFGLSNFLSFLYSRHVKITVIESPVRGEWLLPTPALSGGGVLLYLHGGGYVSCSPQTHRPITTALARLLKWRLFSLDYRLAPEHPFPAAVEDATAAFLWLLESGVPAERIALAGDSAGGGLVVATMLRLRRQAQPLPACAVCLSPWVDLTGLGKYRNSDSSVLKPDEVATFAKVYLYGAPAELPEASPVFGDLSGLPPLLIQVSSTELLLNDALRLHARAADFGVKSLLRVYPGLPHAWQLFVGTVPEAKTALEEIAKFVIQQVDSGNDSQSCFQQENRPVSAEKNR
jgi:acetyl esterase/lipase